MLKKEKRKVQQEGQDQGINPYSTPQALGKAVGKVKIYLPKSPRKIDWLIDSLLSEYGNFIGYITSLHESRIETEVNTVQLH